MKLPDIADEDKAKIADLEVQLKAEYDQEANGQVDKAKLEELNLAHREAVRQAHQNRMDVINADPHLKKLHEDTLQYAGDK